MIGKGGAKINEIRQASQTQVCPLFARKRGALVSHFCYGRQRLTPYPLLSHPLRQIRIMEPHQQEPANPNERLVTIVGMPENVNAAVQMIHQVRHSQRTLPAAPLAARLTVGSAIAVLQRLEHEKAQRLQQQQQMM